MTGVDKAKKSKVIFDALNDIAAGDTLRIHFNSSSTNGALSLVGMIRSGMITSVNEARLTIIAALGTWGDRSNRDVEIVATDTFDRVWFEKELAYEINKLVNLSH